MAELSYRVPAISCDHCVKALTGEVGQVPGVEEVAVDLAAKVVTVRGEELYDSALRAAIDQAGYDVQD
jgi:copper chaperone